VYLNGTYLVHIYHPHAPEEYREELMRVLVRWPLVRIDRLDPSNRSVVKSSLLYTYRAFYAVRRLKGVTGRGSYVLTRRLPVPWPGSPVWQGDLATDLALGAVNRGWLPFVPLSFFGIPLDEYLLRNPEIRRIRAVWTEVYGCRAVRVEIEQEIPRPNKPPAQGRFWFVPDLGWIPVRWEWGRLEGPREKRGNWVVQISYGDKVRGVPIAKRARAAQVSFGKAPDWEYMVWEAEMLSYQLEPPPEREFTLAAFGIPEPPQEPSRSRLWLWTLIGALGTLTALFLIRLFGARRREKHGSA